MSAAPVAGPSGERGGFGRGRGDRRGPRRGPRRGAGRDEEKEWWVFIEFNYLELIIDGYWII